MKERPILFSAPMVRAILEGKKTQTRRVWKQPTSLCMKDDCLYATEHDARQSFNPIARDEIVCPYGQRGDRLWVREAFHICPHHEDYFYRADDENLPLKCKAHTKWKPSIHMPRRASRITLEITSIRVERLQDISDADALAEGVDQTNTSIRGYAAERFKRLWSSINGADSWHSNPWVWVIEFKKVEAVS